MNVQSSYPNQEVAEPIVTRTCGSCDKPGPLHEFFDRDNRRNKASFRVLFEFPSDRKPVEVCHDCYIHHLSETGGTARRGPHERGGIWEWTLTTHGLARIRREV